MNISSAIKTMAVASCLISGVSSAASQLSPIVGIGYGWGGDTLVLASYANGDSDKLKANEGVSLFGGADLNLMGDYTLRGTIGYKLGTVSAANGDIDFERVPLELTLFKSFQQHKFGAGVAYHTAVSLDCRVTGLCNETDDFENAVGFTLQYEYRFKLVGIGTKYTHIEYKHEDTGTTFDGSGIDIYLALHF